MDIAAAQQVMVRTHIAALRREKRANGLLLESGPGIGKSDGTFQAVEMLARALGEPAGLTQFMLATISSVDVRGFMLPVKGNNPGELATLFSKPPWFPALNNSWVFDPLASHGEGRGAAGETARLGQWFSPGTYQGTLPRVGILFLDEFSQAEDEVKKPAAELIYKGNVGTCTLPIGWRVVAAGNRTSDRSGVLRELMFIVNRRCRLSIDASLPAWLDWANKQPPGEQPHYLTMSFAQKNPDLVFRDTVPEGTDPFCTPRTLCLADKDMMALRSEEDEKANRLPLDPIAREVVAGWLGGACAAQFFTHLRYADMLPDIEDIEKDPNKAKCPNGRDAQMVAAYMLAHHVTEKNAGSILKYLGRLNIEMQVLSIRAISAQIERAKAIVVNPLYMVWLSKHKDLLIASQS
jgi:hypothetical protein